MDTVARCLRCGRPVTDRYPDPEAINIPRRERQILAALVAARGRYLHQDRLHHALYGDDPDGGPLVEVVQTHVCKLRQKLAKLGWNIENARFEGYRLVRLTPERTV